MALHSTRSRWAVARGEIEAKRGSRRVCVAEF